MQHIVATVRCNYVYLFLPFLKMNNSKKEKEEEEVSFREFARMIGVTDTSVRRMINDSGRIKKSSINYTNPKRPLINVEKAKRDMSNDPNYSRPRETLADRQPKKPIPLRAKKTQKTVEEYAADIFDEGLDNGDDDEDIEDAILENTGIDITRDPRTVKEGKAQEAIWKAIKIKTEVKKMLGELMPVTEVNRQLTDAAVQLRERLLGIPDKHSAKNFSAKTKIELRNLMYSQIEAVLNRFSNMGVWSGKEDEM